MVVLSIIFCALFSIFSFIIFLMDPFYDSDSFICGSFRYSGIFAFLGFIICIAFLVIGLYNESSTASLSLMEELTDEKNEIMYIIEKSTSVDGFILEKVYKYNQKISSYARNNSEFAFLDWGMKPQIVLKDFLIKI